MTNRTFTFATLSGLVLLAAAAQTKGPAPKPTRAPTVSREAASRWFSELPDGRGGTNVEAIAYPKEMGFDKARSLKAFQATLYPLLRANCSGCHSTQNTSGSGAQAPLHADVDVNLAHEYALTRVNFREPEDSKLVVRMRIDRHNCFGETCAAATAKMLQAVTAWRDAVADTIPAVPRGVDQSTKITDRQILDWIKADKATIPAAEREFIQYASFHVLHNAGVSAQNMNHARVGLSKALNSTARWAPRIVNPVDVNGKGILYRFDIRDYWGYTLIDTSDPKFALFYGGSDDDLAFAKSKVDLSGNPIKYESLAGMVHRLKPEVTRDDKFARLVWARVLKGNAEGAADGQSLPPNRDPRILRNVSDKMLNKMTGFGRTAGIDDHRLNTASSCIGCHIDGMNRSNNDLRDWLDQGGSRLPKGEYGVDGWVNDASTVARVRELYPPSSKMRVKTENDRRVFLQAMAQIKQEMILGVDKNVYVEPTIWTIEWARDFYKYPVTRSN